MKIEIWSDFQCPFCYMGEKQLEMALSAAALTEPVEIDFRSYQLDPDAPSVPSETMAEHFMGGHEMTLEEAKARMARITAMAAKTGLNYNLAGVKVCNTADAHRLMKYAAERLSPGKLKRPNMSLFKANFEENLLLSDPAVLAGIAEAVGLDRGEVEAMLRGGAYREAVEQDQRELDSRPDFEFVPFMLASDGSVRQGVLSMDGLGQWLSSIMSGVKDEDAESKGEGCGPGGCRI